MNDIGSVGRARAPLHVVFVLLSASLAVAQDVAPVDSEVFVDDAIEDAIGDERRARYEQVQSARESDDPFQPSGVWLPPFYLADAERSIEWIGLLYLDMIDFEEGTRARVLPPLFLWLGGPDDRTLITPFFGASRDAEGEAGYAGTYVWRRDVLDDSDIVLPFFWSFREREVEDGPDTSHFTTAAPLFWQWGDAHETTTIAAPFLVSHSEGDRETLLIPPLLTYHHADGESSLTIIANTYIDLTPTRARVIGFPLLWHFSDRESTTTIAAPLAWYTHDSTGSRVLSPLMYHRADEASSKTIVLGLYWDLRGPELHARVAFPLWWQFEDVTTGTAISTFFPLFWKYDRAQETTCVLINTAWSSGVTDGGAPTWSFHFFPFVDVGSDGPDHFRWQVFGGLLGRESRGERSRWRLAFNWTDPS
jgi:hypothetical protein